MKKDLSKEINIKTSRSGGKGGQNVNKVETQVEARFNITTSNLLTAEEKAILLQKLSSKLNKQNELVVVCNEYRTQLSNKEKAIDKLHILIEKNLITPKLRKKTKASKAVHARRMDGKTLRGQLKEMRSKKIDY